MLNRALDIFISLVGILFLLPILPFIATLIKIDSKGPVFYRCDRVGLHGKVFKMLKFRTMYETQVQLGPNLSPQGDPRVTSVGRVLRRLKLNEFPQFFNVLRGEMTLVGPRPEATDLAAAYPDDAAEIFSVKPGLMGPNQILGRNEEELYPPGADPVQYYLDHILPRKLPVDLEYIRDKSFFRDLKYLYLAVKVVVTGAISRRHFLDNRGQLLLFICDAILCLVSFTLAHFIRYEGFSQWGPQEAFISILPWAVLLRLPVFIYFGFYHTIIRHIALYDFKRIFQGVALGSLILASLSFLFGFTRVAQALGGYARGVFLIDWFCLTILLVSYRLLFKKISLRARKSATVNGVTKRVFIWGAGDAGEICLKYLEKERDPPIVVIGFIDDDPQKKGKRLGGIKVLGDRNHLGLLRQLHDVHTVFLAIPSASFSELRNVLDLCRGLGFDTEVFLARNDIFAKLFSEEQPVTNTG